MVASSKLLRSFNHLAAIGYLNRQQHPRPLTTHNSCFDLSILHISPCNYFSKIDDTPGLGIDRAFPLSSISYLLFSISCITDGALRSLHSRPFIYSVDRHTRRAFRCFDGVGSGVIRPQGGVLFITWKTVFVLEQTVSKAVASLYLNRSSAYFASNTVRCNLDQ